MAEPPRFIAHVDTNGRRALAQAKLYQTPLGPSNRSPFTHPHPALQPPPREHLASPASPTAGHGPEHAAPIHQPKSSSLRSRCCSPFPPTARSKKCGHGGQSPFPSTACATNASGSSGWTYRSKTKSNPCSSFPTRPNTRWSVGWCSYCGASTARGFGRQA